MAERPRRPRTAPARRGKPKQKPVGDPNKRLTVKEAEFVAQLLADPRITPTEAARRAGYSERTANKIAWELLNEPKYAHVQAAYKRGLDEKAKRLEITEREIEEDINLFATGSAKRLYEMKDGQMVARPIDELTDEEAALIKRVKITQTPYGPVVNYETHDRFEARKTQAKMKGMLKDQIELKGQVEIGLIRDSLCSKLDTVVTRFRKKSPDSGTPGSPDGPGMASPSV